LNDNKTNELIPIEVFEQSIVQFHHKLLSAEADLHSYGRQGGVSERAFKKRLKKLQEVHKDLTSLHRLCYAETSNDTKQDLGLPPFDTCTPKEKECVESYLESQAASLIEIESWLANVHTWINSAIEGKSLYFNLTFQMSNLRKKIQVMAKKSMTLEIESSVLEKKVEALYPQDPALRTLSMRTNSIDGMIKIFEKLDQTISRIAKLKSDSRKKKEKLAHIATWISQQEDQIKTFGSVEQTPSVETTLKAAATIREDLHKQFLENQKKRSLVEQFWTPAIADILSSDEREGHS